MIFLFFFTWPGGRAERGKNEEVVRVPPFFSSCHFTGELCSFFQVSPPRRGRWEPMQSLSFRPFFLPFFLFSPFFCCPPRPERSSLFSPLPARPTQVGRSPNSPTAGRRPSFPPLFFFDFLSRRRWRARQVLPLAFFFFILSSFGRADEGVRIQHHSLFLLSFLIFLHRPGACSRLPLADGSEKGAVSPLVLPQVSLFPQAGQPISFNLCPLFSFLLTLHSGEDGGRGEHAAFFFSSFNFPCGDGEVS